VTRELRRILHIPTIALSISTSKPLTFEQGRGLRGYIASQLGDHVLLHHHNDIGLIYSYPRIQYKVINGEAKIIGLGEGAEILKELPHFQKLIIGTEEVAVDKIDIVERTDILGMSDSTEKYRFQTPWLALNEKNYQKFVRTGRTLNKQHLIEKVLIGNIISLAKGLGFTVPEPLKATIEHYEEIETSLKGTPMLGFSAKFSINFQIPEYWGLGKSVSRGFGTIGKVKDSRGQGCA
jgi:hypothetical protein